MIETDSPNPTLFIGLMSGTSMDGVDAVLCDLALPGGPRILSHVALDMPAALRAEFMALNVPCPNELTRSARAGVQLAELYAQACKQALNESGVTAQQVRAIGAHGQTVRHQPHDGYSIQVNAPALLAELTGIDVVADFRSRDIAAGGQGAPLVPVFHQALFAAPHTRVVLNLGGIANITILRAGEPPLGFDTGPANALLDLWCQEKTGALFDHDGQWAATGQSYPPLLTALFENEPWFQIAPPKSTGRDLFNREWLYARLKELEDADLGDADIQASLQSLTALSVQQAIATYAADAQEVLVCGGGALNGSLMRELAQCLKTPVRPTSELGVPVQTVEALAFAWLAWAHVSRVAAGLPSVTGARNPRVLGACYPA